jgi:NOL1/NOP2/fmu family ribosome biogenesis protein
MTLTHDKVKMKTRGIVFGAVHKSGISLLKSIVTEFMINSTKDTNLIQWYQS